MSLESLRELRRQGARPDAPVIVLVGHKPAWLEDSERHVVLTATSRVSEMDFRPLIGLWAVVLMNEPLHAQADALLAAMQEAGATVYGLVTAEGAMDMGVLDPQPEHLNNLRRTWELYL